MGSEGKDKGGGRVTYESATPKPPPSHNHLPHHALHRSQNTHPST